MQQLVHEQSWLSYNLWLIWFICCSFLKDCWNAFGRCCRNELIWNQTASGKENEFSSGRVIAPVWNRATWGANRVIDHSFPSEAPYALIPGKTQVHLVERCELFSTLLNDKCDLIEIKNDFFCVCNQPLNTHPFLQAFVVHHPTLTHLSNHYWTMWRRFYARLMQSPNGKSCFLMNKIIFTYKILYE